ncbi:putative high affinity immunoglobulin gamma Fc receptor IB [Labrus bergylta]|uniref:putative high affinity immunoglobulin gamma Fc receptor IB n=1 Tax=Labrus bergylta TaxID=56723 RepID=UPI0033134183
MDILLISSLLGAFVLQVASSEDSVKVSVSAWPPGSNIYLHESVLLRCTVDSNSSFAWSFRWFRHPTPTPNPRHLVSGDSYSITAVTREDEGSYQCGVEQRERNISSVVLLSQPVDVRVSDTPPPSLTLTPSSRHLFRGETFSLQCPGSLSSSSGWTLRRFPPGPTVRSRRVYTDWCSPLGGAGSADQPDTCVFNAARETSGLYWCEGAEEGRSNAVSIAVSYGSIILRTPASPVSEDDAVSLVCQYWTGTNGTTIFFKNGAEILTSTMSSISGREIKMIIENVTQEDEGFYKCAFPDRQTESPESWLSVRPERGNSTTKDGTATSTGSWIWIVVLCILFLLLLIPLSVWLVRRYRYHTVCTCSCCPVSKEELQAVELPVTKQEVSEVQWDLSWMEMSNLLDRNVYPDT